MIGKWRIGADIIPIRNHPEYGIQICVKKRLIVNRKDKILMLYDDTWEIPAESLETDEKITQGVLRAGKEELGHLDFSSIVRILEKERTKTITPRAGDEFLGFKPYYCVQQTKRELSDDPERLYFSISFVAVMPPDFEPLPDKTNESGNYVWWSPQQLLDKLNRHPDNFFGPHILVLHQVAKDLLTGKLLID